MTDRTALSELGQAALRYVEMGFAVIPLVERDKKPATAHGLNDWTDNPEDVTEWWAANPNDNIGIVCGQPSHGLLVIDIDVDESKDRDGYATLRDWETTNGALPETAVSITGKGGMHYLYRMDTTRPSISPSANIALGIDIRCDKSYIVAPPSIHPNGNRYEWQDSPEDVVIADADGNVYALVDFLQRTGEINDLDTKKDNGKFKLPDTITEGNRDKTLYRYGCHLRALDRTPEEISDAIYGANAKRCDPPLDKATLNKIVRSVCTKPAGKSAEYADNETDKKPEPVHQSEPWRSPKGAILHHVLAQKMINENRACLIGGAPAIWTGTRWDMGVDAIERMACKYCQDIKQTVRNEVMRYIILNAPTLDISSDFDGTPYVQFANVTLNALTGESVEPTPEMLIANTLATPYDDSATSEVIWQFFKSISGEDDSTARLMLEVVAACMCSMQVTAEAIMMLGKAEGNGGEASNGKSTYIATLKSMLGGVNVSSLDITMLTKPFHRGTIVGKLANLGDDIPNSFLTGDALSTFKQMVTGDDVFADVKGTKGFSFTPTATLIFSMNDMPRLGDTTEGVFRRLAFLPFRRTFRPGMPGFDPHIKKKLTTPEARRTLARMAFTALPELAERGRFRKLADMAEEIEQVKLDNDVVLRWLDDTGTNLETLDHVSTSDAFGWFETWAAASGESHGSNHGSIRKATFVKRVIKAFRGEIKSDTRVEGGHKTKMFLKVS